MRLFNDILQAWSDVLALVTRKDQDDSDYIMREAEATRQWFADRPWPSCNYDGLD